MNEHVSYEYVMMKEMEVVMNGGHIHTDVINNMWNIVSYNTAYNLIVYMRTELDISYDEEIATILSKVYHQIRSISDRRTSNQEDKLQPKDFMKLIAFIEENKDKLGSSSAGSNAGL